MPFDPSFKKISENTSPDVAIVLRGLGAVNETHPDFVSFLVKQGMEVCLFDRKGDHILIRSNAIKLLCSSLQEKISSLLWENKRVHLIGNGFGILLPFFFTKAIQKRVQSIVGISPIIDPVGAIENNLRPSVILQDCKEIKISGYIISIHYENITRLAEVFMEKLQIPGIFLLGGNDIFAGDNEDIREQGLKSIPGDNLSKVFIPGLGHSEMTGHPETRKHIEDFYKGIQQSQ